MEAGLSGNKKSHKSLICSFLSVYCPFLSSKFSGEIRTRTLKATAEVNNLFGQDYDVVLNYPMPKTNFRFVVSVDL